MRKNFGSALIDYVLPTAIIGTIAGLALYSIFKNESIVKNIIANVDGEKKQTELIVNPRGNPGNEVSPGSLGGTQENPKMKCTMGVCTIDYGKYVLEGIPAEMSDITSAGRGGEMTDVYASILEQLAEYLEQVDPAQSDVLQRLAEEAREMADVELFIDQKVTELNDIQEKIFSQVGVPYEKVSNVLSTIDPANLQEGDLLKIIGSAKYLNKAGLLSDNQLQNFFMGAMSVKQSYPNLSEWQTNFLNTVLNTPENISNAINLVNSNLSANEQNVILNQNKPFYTVATNKADMLMASINSGSTEGPGYNFNQILTNEVPSAGFSADILNVVNYSAGQIQAMADSLERQEQNIGPNAVIETVIIPENAGIETNIAATIIDQS